MSAARTLSIARRQVHCHHHRLCHLLAKGEPQRPEHPISDVLEMRYTGNKVHPTQKAVSALLPLIEMPPAIQKVREWFEGGKLQDSRKEQRMATATNAKADNPFPSTQIQLCADWICSRNWSAPCVMAICWRAVCFALSCSASKGLRNPPTLQAAMKAL